MTATVLTNARLAAMTGDSGYGIVDDAVIAVNGDRIAYAGPSGEYPGTAPDATAVDCGGRLVTPGLIDCHTHVVHAGNRAREFEQRLEGASYTEIARLGGGIMNTVTATRAADEETLLAESAPRFERILTEGVTTVEIKSGYGLDVETEMKMLRVARRLGERYAVRVRTTFLGAHALPPAYAGNADGYIDLVCEGMLPAAAEAGLVDAVDVFCENIAFSTVQASRVFDAARALNLPFKCHAEQLSNQGGAVAAARRGALSVDHLEYLDAKDVPVLAEHGTVAVLLPGAFYMLRETQLPPLDALRRHRVPMAIATDCNPGSSPVTSLLLTMNMACTLFRMTPFEALAGVTRHAARALGLAGEVGTLEDGKLADLALWNVAHPAELAVNLGLNPCAGVMASGAWRVRPDFVEQP